MKNTREGNRIRSQRFRERHREELRQKSREANKTPERKAYLAEYHSRTRFGGLRFKVLERDNYRCQQCGFLWVENSRKIVVHHIDHDPTNNTMDNLATLCRSCHPVVHGAWSEERRIQHSRILKASPNMGHSKGKKHTEETKKKISQANKGRKLGPEFGQKIKESKTQWWSNQSPERRAEISANISAARKGKASRPRPIDDTCIVDGCDQPYISRKLCSKHYTQRKRGKLQISH